MRRQYVKYIMALLFFGSNGVVAGHIDLNSYETVYLRTLLGELFLGAVFLLSRRDLTVYRSKRDVLLVSLSGFAMAADWLFLFEAYDQIGVSLAILINYVGPVMVVAVSPFVFGEEVTKQKVIALGAAFIGVFLISGQAVVSSGNTWGILCAVLSAISYTAMVVFNKMAREITGMANATLQLFAACFIVVLFVGLKQGFYINVAAGDWLPVLWLGIINTGVGCYLYFSSIGHLPAQTVAIFGYLEPLSAVVFAMIFLHEIMLPLQVVGAILIIGGALYGEHRKTV